LPDIAELKGKTLSPLINTDATDRRIAFQFPIFGNRSPQHSLILTCCGGLSAILAIYFDRKNLGELLRFVKN
jgi:hypothetical protein